MDKLAHLKSSKEQFIWALSLSISSSFLVVGVVCFPATSRLNKAVRLFFPLIGASTYCASSYYWRTIRLSSASTWQAEEAVIEEIQAAEFLQGIAKAVEPEEQPINQPVLAGAQGTAPTIEREVNRLLDEVPLEQRRELLEKWWKGLESASSKDSSDLEPTSSTSSKNQEPTCENPVPEPARSAEEAELEQINLLVSTGGLSIAQAIQKLTGYASSHSRHRKLRAAYKQKFGE